MRLSLLIDAPLDAARRTLGTLEIDIYKARSFTITLGIHVPLEVLNMTGVRIDKWLWAARFFKTRALASKACELGRVQSNGLRAKPAREVHISDKLHITTDGGDFEIEVLALSEMRGPATMAKTLYRESDASREARQKLVEERRVNRDFNAAPQTRPSKRDRRRIIQFRGGA